MFQKVMKHVAISVIGHMLDALEYRCPDCGHRFSEHSPDRSFECTLCECGHGDHRSSLQKDAIEIARDQE